MSKLKPAVSKTDHGIGNKDANITLVEFGDYQCSHCGHAYPLLKRLTQEIGNQLYFVFRNFPLQEVHPFALMAAQAAEAAAKQNKFWEMHDMIYEHQEEISSNNLLRFAEILKLDLEIFIQDCNSEKILQKIEADFESGARSGVNGTPSFFVNGEMLTSYDGTYRSLVEGIQTFA